MDNNNLEATVVQLIKESRFETQGLTLGHLLDELQRMEHPECPTKDTSPSKQGPQTKLKDHLIGMSRLQSFLYKGEDVFKLKHSVEITTTIQSEASDIFDQEQIAMTNSKKEKLQAISSKTTMTNSKKAKLQARSQNNVHGTSSKSKKLKPVNDNLEENPAAINDKGTAQCSGKILHWEAWKQACFPERVWSLLFSCAAKAKTRERRRLWEFEDFYEILKGYEAVSRRIRRHRPTQTKRCKKLSDGNEYEGELQAMKILQKRKLPKSIRIYISKFVFC